MRQIRDRQELTYRVNSQLQRNIWIVQNKLEISGHAMIATMCVARRKPRPWLTYFADDAVSRLPNTIQLEAGPSLDDSLEVEHMTTLTTPHLLGQYSSLRLSTSAWRALRDRSASAAPVHL